MRGERIKVRGRSRQTMTTPREQFPKLVECIRGFRATYLAAAGVKLGLFQKIAAAAGITAEQLAQDLDLHAPYVLIWCRTAHALEIGRASCRERV